MVEELDIRLDFNFSGDTPVLIGVAIDGFGWIVGGASPGQLSLRCKIGLLGEVISRGDNIMLSKLRKSVAKAKSHHPWKTLPVEEM